MAVYPKLLFSGKLVGSAAARGGMVEINLGDAKLVFGDGVGIRCYGKNDKPPGKHQLWVEFEDAPHSAKRISTACSKGMRINHC